MNELLAKLTNLGYEVLGVLLPGLISILFVLLWWNTLGSLAPAWSGNVVPELTTRTVSSLIDSFNIASGIGIAVPALAICYFAGHLLLWISRSGAPNKEACKNGWCRVGLSLVFRIPKPEDNYSPKLQRLYDQVQREFALLDNAPLTWREFYPLAKIYLLQHTSASLIPTYQNKYTLHRSITAAAAVLFWFGVLSLLGALVTYSLVPPSTYVMLSCLSLGAVILIWGFSSSYVYHWEMFGNTVITELYSLVYGPSNEQRKR